MTMAMEILASALLVIGGLFGLVGSFGLVKLRDSMQRLHAPTKATTLGVGSVLIASLLYFNLVNGQTTLSELLITLFLFLTAPVTANFISKAFMHRNISEADLPPTAGDIGWGGYNEAPEERATRGARTS
jgi:multicomponent K+:H+ antiporter subunit G